MHKIVCGLQIAAQASGSFIKNFKSSVSNLDSLSDVAAFTLLHLAFSHLYALTCKHQTGKKVHNKFSNVIYQNVYFLRTFYLFLDVYHLEVSDHLNLFTDAIRSNK